MANHVGSPVLGYTHGNETVQCHGSRHHEFAHQVIILFVLFDERGYLHEGSQNTFAPAIHQVWFIAFRHILFHDMNKSVCQSTGNLEIGKRESDGRVENGKDGIVGIKRILLMSFPAWNHGSVVHFGTGGRDSQHCSQWNSHLWASFFHQFPGVSLVWDTCGNQFGAINDRTTAYGKQEIYILFLAYGNCLFQCVYIGIGLNSPKLGIITSFECLGYLFVNSVCFDTSSSKGNHDTLVGRNLLSQLVYHSFTEKESGRVVKNEIIHNLYWVFYCLERKDRVFSLSLIKILANERKTRKIQSIKGCERSRLWSLSGWRRWWWNTVAGPLRARWLQTGWRAQCVYLFG